MTIGQLPRDLALLGHALDAAIVQLDGTSAHELCVRFGDDARALRGGRLSRATFAERVAGLDVDALEELARAFALQCHLMNVAEERARLQALRARGDHPGDGLAAAVDALAERGEAEVRALLDRALVMPVLTAHPTEARRRSALDHLMRLEQLLDEIDSTGRARAEAALGAEVLAFYATEDARVRRPTPLDEVENSLEVFRRSLLDVTPRIYRTIEDRLAARFGAPWRVPSFLRWGTWVGGDRDGNPNVTATVTRAAFTRQRATALARYHEDVVRLGRSLSISSRRASGDLAELEASLVRDRERLPHVAARARPRTPYEPWREKLWYVQALLRAAIEQRDDGYDRPAEYRDDLAVLDRALRSVGLSAVADQELRDALRRVEVFGFHLASLDLRQHSGVHDQAVAELLARGGRPGYLERDEAGRRAWLCDVLATPLAPERDRSQLSPCTAELLATAWSWTPECWRRSRDARWKPNTSTRRSASRSS
jgi:phosphoenolpyruvate carboxylase